MIKILILTTKSRARAVEQRNCRQLIFVGRHRSQRLELCSVEVDFMRTKIWAGIFADSNRNVPRGETCAIKKGSSFALPKNDWTWANFPGICRAVTRDTDGNGLPDQFGGYDYSWQRAAISNGVKFFRVAFRAFTFAQYRTCVIKIWLGLCSKNFVTTNRPNSSS